MRRRIGNNGPMTVVREHARVPPLDDAAYRRLAEAFDVEGIVSAMVIGSQARGTAGPLSDIDIAYWHDPRLDAQQRFRLRLRLIAAATKALSTDEVDVIPLNTAPPLMQHRAMRDGRRFIERDAKTRVRLETRALIEYLDTAPLRDALSRGLEKSIREGTFGRRRKH